MKPRASIFSTCICWDFFGCIFCMYYHTSRDGKRTNKVALSGTGVPVYYIHMEEEEVLCNMLA